MPDPEARLGGRLPLLEQARLTQAQKTLWDRMDATMGRWAGTVGFASKTPGGRFIGPFSPMLRSPDTATTFLQLQLDEAEHTSLSERVPQVVILSVGSVWKSSYELYAHAAAGRRAGFSNQCVCPLVSGAPCPELAGDEALTHALRWRLPPNTRSAASSKPKRCGVLARRGSSIW